VVVIVVVVVQCSPSFDCQGWRALAKNVQSTGLAA
jgi:hypothetical protein